MGGLGITNIVAQTAFFRNWKILVPLLNRHVSGSLFAVSQYVKEANFIEFFEKLVKC